MKRILLPLAALIFTACATQPQVQESAVGSPTGRRLAIDARAQIQDKVEKKTVTVQIEAIVVEPSVLRMDVSGGFGSLIGKMIWRGEQMLILLPQQKKAYYGKASENALGVLLPVRLHPQRIAQFLLGEVPPNWTCQPKSNSLESCLDPTKTLVLEHDPRPDQAKSRWSVTSPQFALTVLPSNIKTNVQVKPGLFSMDIPEGYSKHKLP